MQTKRSSVFGRNTPNRHVLKACKLRVHTSLVKGLLMAIDIADTDAQAIIFTASTKHASNILQQEMLKTLMLRNASSSSKPASKT